VLSPETKRKRLIEKTAKAVYTDLKMPLAWTDLPEKTKASMRGKIEAGFFEATVVAAKYAVAEQRRLDAEIVLASVDRVPDNTVMSLVITEIAEEIDPEVLG
jgi:hypothetical protein